MKRFLIIVFVGLVVLAGYLYHRPVPSAAPVKQIVTVPQVEAVSLPWPAASQSAIGADGYGVLATNGSNQPAPIASIAKVITALAVLQKKPLAAGSQGPTITLDSTDLDYFNHYYNQDGSTAKVTVGEQITEYQALQAMLIPSANNMADSLARWAFGSTDSYVTYANNMVKQMGLINTKATDASGFTDGTTSTAEDLVKLGEIAIKNEAIAKVVNQQAATVPVAGDVKNINWLLGSDGVVGIKTGNTDKAGGCYLFAAKRTVNGHNITLIGASLGSPDLNKVINESDALIKASDSGFKETTVIHKNQALGYYQAPWGSTAKMVANKDVSMLSWKGQEVKVINSSTAIKAPAKSGQVVGTVTIQNGDQKVTTPVSLSQDLPGPSIWWHLSHK